ncbi:chorismate mutase [Streptomyces tsukubensis]|uniref:Chorismate mutase n=1 Tax=Streptomyces tsukubensis TaxID=83656 RepID=A0A1V4A3T3_9ACTN|nr:chorismate mutase [Streptomyces tsukubensis]OON74170.1 chorismate mutase [Streptomyces tsukubensis]QFR95309.1 chorismate mutase [Streptomyces tsukubensis]
MTTRTEHTTAVPATTDGTAGSAATDSIPAGTAAGEVAAELAAGSRDRIDALDDRIIGLVQERMAVSAVVQEARLAAGGRRISLSRENEVLNHYRQALGKRGTTLAMTLLELSRGKS